MESSYDAVIGLEVHAELLTNTKIFCGCSTEFGSGPNENTCPICLGMPGTLPVLNKKVLELAVTAGLALNCDIEDYSKFDRKNYFYPDLPKAYQISQFDLPVAKNGFINVEVEGENKTIRINRIHIEEDAGKLVHSSRGDSLVDFNRSGIPLIEIVTEPDISSPAEAKAYLDALKNVLQYTDVSDCKMEEGSLRCDANVSIMPHGSDEFGTKTEVKNMNSFKAVEKALEYEVKRQVQAQDENEEVIQETRRWDEENQRTISMRSKEEAHDYRYFPEPDLLPVVREETELNRIKSQLPELPREKMTRFIEEYKIPSYDASVITSDKKLADFFDNCAKKYSDNPKKAANWIMGDILRIMNEENRDVDEIEITPDMVIELCRLEDEGTISSKLAKEVFEEMYKTKEVPEKIVEQKGLKQISDQGEIEQFVEEVIEENPAAVEDYKNGKDKVMGFLVGQVMKKSKGKANPQMVNDLLKEKLPGS